jgi:transcriptional regulator with XRE-family HTH domain
MRELKRIRISTGMKQSQVADIYGIPRRTYQNWELGLRNGPSYVINRIIRDLKELQPGETYKSVVMIKFTEMGTMVIPCKNRSIAEKEALNQFDQFDESEYTRIVAGSMKKGGSYSYEIKEEYIDIK